MNFYFLEFKNSIQSFLRDSESLRYKNYDIIKQLLSKISFNCKNDDDHKTFLKECFMQLIEISKFKPFLKLVAISRNVKIEIISNDNSPYFEIKGSTLIINNLLDGKKSYKYCEIAEQIRTLVIEYIKEEKHLTHAESHDEPEEFEERCLKSKEPQSLKLTRYFNFFNLYYFSSR